MNAIFSRFALLSVISIGAGPLPSAASEGVSSGQRLIAEAAQRIAGYQTIEASLRVQTDVLGQPLVGSGGYAQLRATSGLLLRLELTIQAGGKASSFKQICNGPNLWEHWRIGGKERLNHIDLRRVEQELAKVPARPTIGDVSSSLIRGGLPQLLVQLEQNFDFATTDVRRQDISHVATWVVVGVWRQEPLSQLAPHAFADGKLDPSKLPPHLPHQVALHLGESDLFPYRITYFGGTKEGDETSTMRPLVTTEFYEVAIDKPLDPAQFNYQQPNNVRVADRTEAFLKSLGVATNPDRSTRR